MCYTNDPWVNNELTKSYILMNEWLHSNRLKGFQTEIKFNCTFAEIIIKLTQKHSNAVINARQNINSQ